MVLYHGAHTAYTSHVGQCYTDRLASAEVYATSRGYLAEIEIDLSQLKVVSVDGYDRDENTAVGDSAADTVDADGTNNDGIQMWRRLIWEDEASSENDDGQHSIAQLTRVGGEGR